MRRFSIRPTLTLNGRTFKGPRGWSGKPLHPPLTDFPIAAYVLAAVFDVISAVAGREQAWAREFWHAGTFTFIAGAAVSLLAALTGLWDAWKSSEAGTQARRTINTHATIMLTVTAVASVVKRRSDALPGSGAPLPSRLKAGPTRQGSCRVDFNRTPR